MAKFLSTAAATYHLEEMIKTAKDRLILISPFLSLNDRIKELLEDKNRLKIDVRIVYGKSALQADQANWLKSVPYVRTSFCKNLHAKCYLNEKICIITSLNLYESSQVNNYEMGVLIDRLEDVELYDNAYEKVQRIIRISEEDDGAFNKVTDDSDEKEEIGKLTTSKLAKKLGKKTNELLDILILKGYLKDENGKKLITTEGKDAGGESRFSQRFGIYFLWPEDLDVLID